MIYWAWGSHPIIFITILFLYRVQFAMKVTCYRPTASLAYVRHNKIFTFPAHSLTAVPTALPKTNGVILEDFHHTKDFNKDFARVLEMEFTFDDDFEPDKKNVSSTSNYFMLDPLLASIKAKSGTGMDIVKELCHINKARCYFPWRAETQRQELLGGDLQVPPHGLVQGYFGA